MSAYGALFSLENTIINIFISSRLSPTSKRIISDPYEKLQVWKKILQRLDESSKSKSRKKLNALDGQIKQILRNFEDSLESLLLSHHISLQSGDGDEEVRGEVEDDDEYESDGDEDEDEGEEKNEEEGDGDEGKGDGEDEDEDEDEGDGDEGEGADEDEDESDGDDGEGEDEDEREGDVLLISIDLQSLQKDVDSFIQTLNNMEEEYIYEVDNMPEDEDEDESCIFSSSTTAAAARTLGKTKSKMIGLSDEFEGFQGWLLQTNEPSDDEDTYNIVCQGFVGMAGLGKTTLARKIYEDPQIMSHYDFRLWITLGRKSYPRLNQDLQTMLAELKGDEKCLVVLDDAWETQELPSLLTSFLEMKNTIIRILITTRERNVMTCVRKTLRRADHEVLRFMSEDESKELLCHNVFGENIICPPQLVKAATKIAKKCEGLPLTIVTVADLLSKAQNNDPEYWEDVAEERNSVFNDAYAEITKVLYPSYNYLPQHLKMPFLYLGVFPRDYEIPLSKIINTLTAEGWFLDPHKQEDESPEQSVVDCLTDLCDSHNLVLFKPKSTRWSSSTGFGTIKTCRLHSSWRYLCREEARKNKFYHVLNRLVDASEESLQGQRCLCLENNLLFGLTEFSNSVRLNSASSYTRSLIFFGPYHQYPTPIDTIGFKLLRELDALQLRFYAFPTEILKLIQLKYIALTCNGQLPPTISKLFNLKTLIIHPHMSITKCCDTNIDTASSSSYLPIEIWDMKELEHIEIMGKSFPPPPNDANSLKNVSTLLGVNAASICNISKLFQRFPNIRKLGVQMELTPNGMIDHTSHHLILNSLANISTCERLETLKYSIMNQVVKYGRTLPPSSSFPRPLMLPRGLEKLHLSGMGFPWEYMDAVGCLPKLEVLKLRCYAFRGSKWKTQMDSFPSLRYLVIEDSDLVQWRPGYGSFDGLRYLSLKHCFKLEEFHWPSDVRVGKIELVDCNPLAVSCANKFHREDIDAMVFVTVTVSDSF